MTNYLYGIWGSGSGAAWAVGDSGTILELSGTTWTRSSSPTANYLYGVWGSSATNVWAVGDASTLLHWTGTAWAAVSSGYSGYLSAVRGSGMYVWAVGEAWTVLERAGGTWAKVVGGLNSDLYAVSGTSTTDVWAFGGEFGSTGVVQHWNGTGWTSSSVPASALALYGVSAGSPTAAWAVGSGGTIVRWNGTA